MVGVAAQRQLRGELERIGRAWIAGERLRELEELPARVLEAVVTQQ